MKIGLLLILYSQFPGVPAPSVEEDEYSSNCIQCIGLGYQYCGATYHPFRFTACEDNLDPADCQPGKYGTIIDDCFDPVINPPLDTKYGIMTSDQYDVENIMGGECSQLIHLDEDSELNEQTHIVDG